MIALIGAMPRETEPIIDGIEVKEKRHSGGVDAVIGERLGEKIIVATVGIGLVNAASGTQKVLDAFPDIDTVVVSGICGSVSSLLRINDVVIGEKMLYSDATRDAISESFPYLEEYPSDRELVDFAKQALDEIGYSDLDDIIRKEVADNESDEVVVNKCRLKRDEHCYMCGRIASGNKFVTTDNVASIIMDTHASAVEMEGAAVAHVVARNNSDFKERRFLAVRAVSDCCGDEKYKSDEWVAGTQPAVDVAARVALGAIDRIIADKNNEEYQKEKHKSIWDKWLDNRIKHLSEEVTYNPPIL